MDCLRFSFNQISLFNFKMYKELVLMIYWTSENENNPWQKWSKFREKWLWDYMTKFLNLKCKPLLTTSLTEKAEERDRKMVRGNGSKFWFQDNVFYIWQSCADEISPMWLHKHYLQIDTNNRHVIINKRKFTRSHPLIENHQEYMAAGGRRRRFFEEYVL